MKMKLSMILLTCILAVATSCNGQSPYRAIKTSAKGDTVSDIGKGIWSIFQDRNNTYWFGNSGQGVYRYDGKQVVNFRKEKGIGNTKDRKENAFISFMAITGSAGGLVWIDTYEAGVWRYDSKNATHIPIKAGTAITSYSMYTDRKGGAWLGTNEAGVYKFNGKAFEKFTL